MLNDATVHKQLYQGISVSDAPCPLTGPQPRLDTFLEFVDICNTASVDPEGGQGSGPPPPWKITSYMGFYRE